LIVTLICLRISELFNVIWNKKNRLTSIKIIGVLIINEIIYHLPLYILEDILEWRKGPTDALLIRLVFFFLAIGLILYGVFWLLLLPLNILGIIIITPLNRFLSFLISKLEGSERLRAIFVVTGIIFFIIGNTLQLIASF
jgi:hypothetical protein